MDGRSDDAAGRKKSAPADDRGRVMVEYDAIRALMQKQKLSVEQCMWLLEISPDDRRALLKMF